MRHLGVFERLAEFLEDAVVMLARQQVPGGDGKGHPGHQLTFPQPLAMTPLCNICSTIVRRLRILYS